MPHQPDSRIEIQALKKRIVEALETFTIEDLRRLVAEIERPLVELALKRAGGNQVRAARMLGLNRNTLRKKIRELDIEVSRGLK